MIQPLADALAARGYDSLTAVQEAVTAPELSEADLLVSAQTGSGKTVGFGLAIAPTLLGEDGVLPPPGPPLALVIAPTRELALQVARELGWLYAGLAARVVSCVGGMDMRDERRALDGGAQIVVGTPGRLRDHIQRGSLDMSGLRAVVLDEADEMLDLGFREDLEFMLDAAPADRRTLLFSATVPASIATLAKTYQRDAVRVTATTGGRQHADIAYQALRVSAADAENAIVNVLRYHEAGNALVFANTRAAVNRLVARFANRGFAVVSLSGELSQTERTHALQALRDGRARVCVATDVAARGLDLPNLDLVIHADLPTNVEGLLHRSGRTGRAGRKGISALILPPRMVGKAERLLRMAKIEAEWTVPPSAEEIRRRDEERLLEDPVWSEAPTPEQAAFAARLLSLHSAEAVAAAFLRLHLSRQSAPEDLDAPDTAPASKPRAPFGPSAWISLSVGRDERAEPRWLLPLLLRAGGLSKEEIGAIRVQQSETFVELSEPARAGFLSRIGANGRLEEGVTATALDAPPDMAARPAPRVPARRSPPPDRTPAKSDAAPTADEHAAPASVPAEPPADDPRPPVAPDAVAPAEPASHAEKAPDATPPPGAVPPRSREADREIAPPAPAPKTHRPKLDAGPARPAKTGGKPWRDDGSDSRPRKPDGDAPRAYAGKPGRKGPHEGKPTGKPHHARPRAAGDASATAKPSTGPRSEGRVANASDPSVRVTRPSQSPAPGGKPRADGGGTVHPAKGKGGPRKEGWAKGAPGKGAAGKSGPNRGGPGKDARGKGGAGFAGPGKGGPGKRKSRPAGGDAPPKRRD